MKFSNPSLFAEFDNWPSGGAKVKCIFQVETNKKGQRVIRQTQNKNGGWCAPKKSTYAINQCIVDGDNGCTYILSKTQYGVFVYSHDFMSVNGKNFYPPSDNPDEMAELQQLLGMIHQANKLYEYSE